MVIFLYVVGAIIIILCLVLIFFVSKNEHLTMVIYKTNMCESDIDDKLKNREDLTIRCINIINRQINLDIKLFEEVKNIKINKVSNYDKDKLLSTAYEEIKKIYEDNPKLNEVKSFDGIIKDLEKLEVELISLRTFYNKYASEFNNMNGKFPYNILSAIRKFKLKNLYLGRELKDDLKELNVVI